MKKKLSFVIIGVSGSGKSSIITSLAKPNLLNFALPKNNKSGTTNINTKYVFNVNTNSENVTIKSLELDFKEGIINSEEENILEALKSLSKKLSRDKMFSEFVSKSSYSNLLDTKEIEDDSEYIENLKYVMVDYFNEICTPAVLYNIINHNNTTDITDINIKSIQSLNKILKISSISLNVTPSKEFKKLIIDKGLEEVTIIDTRGIGDLDGIERNIPFNSTDGLIVINKDYDDSPNNRESLKDFVKNANHLPTIFGYRHSFDREGIHGIDNKETINIDEYVDAYQKYLDGIINDENNKLTKFFDEVKEYSNFIKPVKEIINNYNLNFIPNTQQTNPLDKDGYYTSCYIKACNMLLENAIDATIEYYNIENKCLRLLNENDLDLSSKFVENLPIEIITNKQTRMNGYHSNSYVDYYNVVDYYLIGKKWNDTGYNRNYTTSKAHIRVDLYKTLNNIINNLDNSSYKNDYKKIEELVSKDILKFILKREFDFIYVYYDKHYMQHHVILESAKSVAYKASFMNCKKAEEFVEKFYNENSIKCDQSESAIKYYMVKILISKLFSKMKNSTNLLEE